MNIPATATITTHDSWRCPYCFQPGQWVAFSDDKGELAEQQQGLFHILDRDDARDDPAHCILMNMQGNLFDFNPSLWSFGGKSLPSQYSVTVVSEEMLANSLGYEKMIKVQKMVTAYLKIEIALNKKLLQELQSDITGKNEQS